MRIRHLALITTFALAAPAFAANANAQGPDRFMSPAFQGQPRGRGNTPTVVLRDQRGLDDRARDARDRELSFRYQGRDASWASAVRDGYEAGYRAGRSHRRFDPTIEVLFRGGDRGYNRGWGPRPQFQVRYRIAFRDGYERGYYDALHGRGTFSLSFWWGGRR